MADIVDLHKPERLLWICGACGCSTFYLYNDETTECAACGHMSDGGEWVTPLKDKKQSPEKDDSGATNVISIGTVVFAKRSVLKKLQESSADIVLLAGWREDGSMNSWSGAETAEQRDWAVRKLRELADSYAAIPSERYEADNAADH